MSFADARKVADAVLYEGYVLYPYRASAGKNRIRWQFGVLAPFAEGKEDSSPEPSSMQTDCLIDPRAAEGRLVGKVRFLQAERRAVEEVSADGADFRPVESLEVEGQLWTSWEEGIEREVDFDATLSFGQDGLGRDVSFSFPGQERSEEIRTSKGDLAGRVLWKRHSLEGVVRLRADSIVGPSPLLRLRIRIENRSPCSSGSRREMLPSFFVGTHTLLEVSGGRFLSLTDPPEWARSFVEACENAGTWPVLIGRDGSSDVLLSSPIILPDHPEIAPESPGEFYDGTEIDELLTLRTMTLTDEEKREARATDPRAAELIDRVGTMPPEVLERLHGALRSLPGRTEESQADGQEAPPWWDPAADGSLSPETDSIEVAGVRIAKDSRVRLRPTPGRADAQDMFLEGQTGRVEGVFFDVEGRQYLAVTVENDPAADLHQWHGRYLYFAPDEVEPLRDETGRPLEGEE